MVNQEYGICGLEENKIFYDAKGCTRLAKYLCIIELPDGRRLEFNLCKECNKMNWKVTTQLKEDKMAEFKKYKRKGLSEMRPYILGEDMTDISVAAVDDPSNDMGMIARNPKNHNDQWYVARKYFEDNFNPVCY